MLTRAPVNYKEERKGIVPQLPQIMFNSALFARGT